MRARLVLIVGLRLVMIIGLVIMGAGCTAAVPALVPIAATGPVGTVVAITIFVVGSVIVAIAPTGSARPADVPAEAKAVDVVVDLSTAAIDAQTADTLTWVAAAKAAAGESEGDKLTGAKVVVEIKSWARGCQAWINFWFDVGGQRSRIGPDNLFQDVKPCMPQGFDNATFRRIVEEFMKKGFPLSDMMKQALDDLLRKLTP